MRPIYHTILLSLTLTVYYQHPPNHGVRTRSGWMREGHIHGGGSQGNSIVMPGHVTVSNFVQRRIIRKKRLVSRHRKKSTLLPTKETSAFVNV